MVSLQEDKKEPAAGGAGVQHLLHRVNCANESYRELHQKEQQIGRVLIIAEKDKREAMQALDMIKKLNDQLHALAHDFRFDVTTTTTATEEAAFEFVLPAATPTQREKRRSSLPVVVLTNFSSTSASSTSSTSEAQSSSGSGGSSASTSLKLHHKQSTPHLSPSNSIFPAPNSPSTSNSIPSNSPGRNSAMLTNDITNHDNNNNNNNNNPGMVEQLMSKEAELRRVAARAQQESAKATFLRRKKEALQQRLMIELNKRKHFIKDTKESIERKEKEISRLSFLAEQDKTTGMFLCQQISQLKRSLEGFLQAREESKPETLCNVSLFLLLLLFPLPLPPSPSPFPFSLSILIAIEMHHSKILARCSSDLFGLSDGSPSGSPAPCGVPSPHHHPFVAGLLCTAIGKETEAVMLEDEKRSQELARVKLIVAHESKRVDSLKAKVQELKEGLVAELQQADEQLGLKMHEFMQKQLAIEKVTARAERERARSYFLRDEIVKLTNALGAGKDSFAKKKGKKEEYGPDVAYLSSFSELPELVDKASPSPLSSSISVSHSSSSVAQGTATATATATGTGRMPEGGLAPAAMAPTAASTANMASSTGGATPTPTPTPTPPTTIHSSDSGNCDIQHATTLPLSISNLRARDDPSMCIL